MCLCLSVCQLVCPGAGLNEMFQNDSPIYVVVYFAHFCFDQFGYQDVIAAILS